MATIRAFTTIEQSRKLAEILPLESADMYIYKNIFFRALSCFNGTTQVGEYVKLTDKENKAYPCWSLAALLRQLPKSARLEKGNVTELYRVELPIELEASDWYVDPVDACYNLILKLHELEML